LFCFLFSFFFSTVKLLLVDLVKTWVFRMCFQGFVVFFLMNTYDDVFGVSTKKSEQVGGGQRGSALGFGEGGKIGGCYKGRPIRSRLLAVI